MNIAFASIRELQTKLAKGEFSKKELVHYFINRFQQHDPQLGSSLEVFDIDSILAKSKNGGLLDGIPGLIKDNIAQEGRALTCASKILKGFTATYDATAIARLKAEGALLLGRANMDEFAMGSSNETSAYYPCRNPWNHEMVPGGSSGGSIAAVAAGFVPWALGSETGGSVRQPAALCGIVGLKPTYGLVSRYGLVAYASSLDQIGIATRSVEDNALVLSAIAGHDEHDSSTQPVEKKDYTKNLDGSLPKGLRIGVIRNALHAEGIDKNVQKAIQEAVKVYEGLGAQVELVDIPSIDYSAAVYFILSRAEAASNLARFDGVRYGIRSSQAKTLDEMYTYTRHDGFGDNVRLRILVGNYVLSAGHAAQFYNNAKKVQTIMRNEFNEVFKRFDVLVAPVSPSTAFKLGAFNNDKLQMDLQDYFTCFANLVGIPALALPCGFSQDNMPIGFQLLGAHLQEELLFRVGHAYQQVTSWHTMHPALYKDAR